MTDTHFSLFVCYHFSRKRKRWDFFDVANWKSANVRCIFKRKYHDHRHPFGLVYVLNIFHIPCIGTVYAHWTHDRTWMHWCELLMHFNVNREIFIAFTRFYCAINRVNRSKCARQEENNKAWTWYFRTRIWCIFRFTARKSDRKKLKKISFITCVLIVYVRNFLCHATLYMY